MECNPATVTPADNTVEVATENDIPSCKGCRRRKLRCSREQPVCAHCKRLDSPCEYDLRKSKPGVKPGAIEALNRRVDYLENLLLQTPVGEERRHQTNSTPTGDTSLQSHQVIDILSLLARELHTLNANSQPKQPPAPQPSSADFNPTQSSDRRSVISPTAASTPSSRTAVDGVDFTQYERHQPRKRRRVDSCGNPTIEVLPPLEELENITSTLPTPELLEDLITVYFNFIQPWIPILHETHFRRRIHDPTQRPKLVVVLHAMMVAALRFVDNPETRVSGEALCQRTARSRSIVLLTAMENLSVESLQALIIVAFADIGNGDAPKAWTITGSLTRTVEYLQLSVESDPQVREPLLKPLALISPPRNWTEEEERRRVFWNIFNLDRFCSVTTGWNTSLTSDDVHRRLPVDGGIWHQEEPVITPYFGIWDRSAARIGNSIAYLPANHFPSPEAAPSDSPASATPATTSGVGKRMKTSVDMTTVGAFAYCIEATESLSRVTTYFLQQKINFHDRAEIGDWLTRFKELDLRLVHWKMFLPQKWKDSNISRQPTLINMDPNLTLAHVTHNTSMILLHQRIAYPEAWWSNIVKLPNVCSDETCQVAAAETATITDKYLRYTPEGGPVNGQFAFCVYISARVLLVHASYYNASLLPEFSTLVKCLDEMARRWVGPVLDPNTADQCLAGMYASRLRALQLRQQTDPTFTIDVLAYSGDTNKPARTSPTTSPNNTTHSHLMEPGPRPEDSPGNATMFRGPGEETRNHTGIQSEPMMGFLSPGMMDPRFSSGGQQASGPGDGGDNLAAISHMLLDQRFVEMDRVITFDDMMFAAAPADGTEAGIGTGWGPDTARME